jgi:MFS family permease
MGTVSAEPGTVTAPSRALWRDRDFGIFWLSQTLSVVGDSFALIAIPLLVLQATRSAAQMGLVTGAAGAAYVVAGLFAGVLTDRLDRRRLLIACDLARMALYAIIPLAWLAGPQVWLLYVVLPLCGAVGMVFSVTYVTVVRNLVGTERVTEANGLLYATYAAAGVTGPLLAGIVSGSLGPAAAIALNAVSFALSAVGLSLIRLRATGSAPARGRPLAELVAGARFLWRTPVLRALTVLLSVYLFFSLGLTDVFIYYVKHTLGRGNAAVGAVLGVAALGTVAGALVVAPVRRRLGFGATWIAPLAIGGLAVAGAGLTRYLPAVAALAAVYLCCESIGGTASMSLRQQITPDHLLGRVTSAFWTIHFSLGPVGAAVLMWAAGRYGVRPVALAVGACCLLIAGAALGTPIRQAHPERTSPLEQASPPAQASPPGSGEPVRT